MHEWLLQALQHPSGWGSPEKTGLEGQVSQATLIQVIATLED